MFNSKTLRVIPGVAAVSDPAIFNNFDTSQGYSAGANATTTYNSSGPNVRLTTSVAGDPGNANQCVKVVPQTGASIDASMFANFTFWINDTQGNNTVKVTMVDTSNALWSGWTATAAVQNTWVAISVPMSSVTGINKGAIKEIRLGEWNIGTYFVDGLQFNTLAAVIFNNFDTSQGYSAGANATAAYNSSGQNIQLTTSVAGDPGNANQCVKVVPQTGVSVDASTFANFTFWINDTQGNNTVKVTMVDTNNALWSGWTTTTATLNTWVGISLPMSSVTGINKGAIKEIRIGEWNRGTYYIDGLQFDNSAASGTWGVRTFAPYVDITAWPTPSINDTYAKTGQKYYTLAFIVSDSSTNPSWGGVYSMSDNFYLTEVNNIRSNGGDVIVSFGGAAGQELALTNTNVTSLQAKYQAVIDKYKLTWIDFDIEGGATGDTASVDRRNKAIKGLQDNNPGLHVAYCLPVMPTGLDDNALNLLKNAKTNGVRIDSVNIMAMDYYSNIANGQMGNNAIQAAKSTYNQCTNAGITTKIGVTPLIGKQDAGDPEIFFQSDATTLLSWAQSTSWMTSLHFWSLNRDSGQESTGISQAAYDFTNIFKAFK
jgi:hypothetical protein